MTITHTNTPLALSPGAQYKRLLDEPRILVQPSLPDPLSARIAEDVGIRALSLGGYAMGASRAISEPLLSLEDVAEMMRHIRAVCSLPVMVDAGAGWGEPMHVMHTVRTLELAGAAAIQHCAPIRSAPQRKRKLRRRESTGCASRGRAACARPRGARRARGRRPRPPR